VSPARSVARLPKLFAVMASLASSD
jgi:hypothetical protein